MLINTKFFGEVNIDERDIIVFKDGIPGLEEYKRYVILNIEDSNLKCMQSIDERDLAFIIISPWDYFKDYEVDIDDTEIQELGIKGLEDVVIYNIITIRENKITVNLLAPIAININTKEAKQVLLNTDKYSIRQEIVC